jgi:hypothetical protein
MGYGENIRACPFCQMRTCADPNATPAKSMTVILRILVPSLHWFAAPN